MRFGAVPLVGCLLLLAVCAGMVACAAPMREGRVLGELVERHGLERFEVRGTGFQHRVLGRGDWRAASRVHVYLEGDGLPWASRRRVAADPTPRDPLALRLMVADPTPSLYVGRPCYQGFAKAAGCSPWLWTHGRYGEEVVESLTRAIARLLPPEGNRDIALIGYSGGGVLATLIAARLKGVSGVVTVAANLDIDAWADHHGYSRLTDSINPADQPPLDARIGQLHLVGADDDAVPPDAIKRYLAANPGARVAVIPGFDHRCCWIERWPELLLRHGL